MNAEITARLQATFETHSKDVAYRVKGGLFKMGVRPELTTGPDFDEEVSALSTEIAKLLASWLKTD